MAINARRDSVEARVLAAVAREMGGPVQLSHRLVEDLHADSLDVVHITMSIEEQFRIVIPDGDVESWTTVGAIAGYVRSRTTGKEAA